MTKNLSCNEDLVLDLMNRSKFGAAGQVFVMEAIQHYAQMVLDGAIPGGVMPAWPAIAADVKDRCDAFYGRHSRPHQAPSPTLEEQTQ